MSGPGTSLRRRLLTTSLLCAAVLTTAVGGSALASGQRHVRSVAPQLTAAPAAVAPGETLAPRGRGFPRAARITLLAGSKRGGVERIGAATTGRRGAFTATIRVRADSRSGRYVVRACHDRCSTTASAKFKIVSR